MFTEEEEEEEVIDDNDDNDDDDDDEEIYLIKLFPEALSHGTVFVVSVFIPAASSVEQTLCCSVGVSGFNVKMFKVMN